MSVRPRAHRRAILALACFLALLVRPSSAFEPFAGAVDARYVSRALAGQDVAIFGTVASVAPSTSAAEPTMITLTPPDVAPPVVVGYMPDVQRTVHGPYGYPAVGLSVTAKGTLHDWNGMLVIRAKGPDTIRIEGYDHIHSPEEGGLPSTDEHGYFHAADIPRFPEMVDMEVSYAGTVMAYKPSWNERAPNVITTGDSAGRIEIVFWSDDPPAELTQTGAPVFATGLVQNYRGKLQLRIAEPAHLSGSLLPPHVVQTPVGAARRRAAAASPAAQAATYARSGRLLMDFGDASKIARAENKKLFVVACSPDVPVSLTFAEALERNDELRRMHHIVFGKIDGASNPELLKQYEVYQLPATMILGSGGEVLFRSSSLRPEEVAQLLRLQQ